MPIGFHPLAPMRGFMAQFGPLYQHDATHAIGLRVEAHHLNHLGIAHGGMLATLVDSAIGIVMLQRVGRNQPGVTAHLSLDYLNPARAGDWIEAHVELDKMGRRLRFGGCRVVTRGVCLMKASATFAVLSVPAEPVPESHRRPR
ncbi:PaaI family thioesterase [Paraburkholderia hiiakae]|uniref:PaaI family thioesterase n=1 Tax=Paraburkholderia hiiakae TaxID=1081782 RepID=UPI001F35532B|nr:PaaI family thioesterase [Paraburkholderia hiiakae]